jgi:hypothetical protein
MDKQKLPECGLYTTTLPHPEKPEQVGSGKLVYFHNHSKNGKGIILMPKANEHNVWEFHERGFTVDDATWCHTMQPVPAQGLYLASEPLNAGDDRIIAQGQLVQLGYNGDGTGILFFPTKASSANALLFPDKGIKVDNALLKRLTPVRLAGPKKPSTQVN